MSAQVIPIVTDHARAEWLRKYPAKFLACRMGHDFPKNVPGQRMVARTWFDWDEVTGERTVHQVCRNCGRIRWRPLKRVGRGWILSDQGWKYKDPKGYAQPPGYGIARAEFSDAYWDALITEYDESQERIEAAMERNDA